MASLMIGALAISSAAAAPVKPGAAAELSQPYVDREASENAFLEAYGHFMRNRLWSALDKLSESIGKNVYFVDAYYLRSLALRRLGRYTDAIDAMSQYLEVRRDDHRGRIILDTMESEWAAIKRSVSAEAEFPALSFDSMTINSFTGLPVYNPLSVKGMAGLGKISASEGRVLICDTLGGKVWVFDAGKNVPASLDASRPVAVVPLSPYEMFLFQEDGTVYRISFDGTSGQAEPELAGTLGTDVADAAFIDATFFAIADRKGGAVRFFETSSLAQANEWRPPDAGNSGKLFEPVAVSEYGSLLAVADRGNGEVFVLDSYTLSVLDVFTVETPRDLEWGPKGELYVLNERGELYSRCPSASASADLKMAKRDMAGAWSMAWTRNRLAVTGLSGRTWWIGAMRPGHSETFGAVTLHDPWIETEDGVENLMLRGAVASTYHDFIQNKAPMTQVVWRGEVRPSRIRMVGAGYERGARFYSPSADGGSRNAEIIRAVTISDVMGDIASVSRSGEPIPGVIVLDTRISGSDGQWELFFAFLLQQGTRLDLWALNRPASPLVNRVSRLTLGHTYYSSEVGPAPQNESVEWILSVPLPPDTATFGYPSDTTLSLFSDIDVIRFTDWIPIWPSLIQRVGGEGVLK
jgi:tetratricopeptide (TPR) repeat protein